MDFLIEVLIEIFAAVAEGVSDSEIKVKSKKAKIAIIICTLGFLGFYIFMTIAFGFILFSADEKTSFRVMILIIEILFTWYIVHLIRKIRKAIKSFESEKTFNNDNSIREANNDFLDEESQSLINLDNGEINMDK